MPQSTSEGVSNSIPTNRDPRYFRPTYTSHDSSTDSTLTQTINLCNNHSSSESQEYFICNICGKALKTKKGSKLHKIHCLRRKESTKLTQTLNNLSPNNDSSNTNYNFPCSQTELLTPSVGTNLDLNEFSNLITNLKKNVPILKRIPKGARTIAADKLSRRITTCINTNSQSAWLSLMLFSYECLRIPEKQNTKSLTHLVKENLSHETLPIIKETKFKKSTIEQKVMKKIEDFDTKGAIRIISSNDTVADVTDQNYNKLLSMHPTPSRKLQVPDPPNETSIFLKIDESQVKRSISSFSNGSSSGFDGISPQHLKDLTSKSANDQGQKLLKTITNLVNFMLEGKVNSSILKYIYGANLCALNKKDGGLRPIAVGCVFRRLTAKICCQAVQEKCKNYFQPFQLGFATKQGCEAIIHSTRTFIDHEKNSNKVLVKIDYKNAFNCVERDILLKEIKEIVPELYPFLWQCYSSSSILFFGNKIIESHIGCQQGDPTSSLTFSLAIHPILLKLKSKLKLFYLDDGTLAGDPKTVSEDINVLISESKKIGLTINPNKCELFFTSNIIDPNIETHFRTVLPGIQTVHSSELSLLGSPLCFEGFQNPMNKHLESLKIMVERLKSLPKHVAYFLLKNCLGIPKMLYTLRSVPTFLFHQALRTLDDTIISSLKDILNLNITPKQMKQASLPISHGGIGIRSLIDLSLPTFLSSCAGVTPLVSNILDIPVDELALSFWTDGVEEFLKNYNELPSNQISQHEWDNLVIKKKEESLKFENVQDLARMNAIKQKESGAWLHAFPSRNIGMFMDDKSFQISIGLRLGCDLCREFQCVCGEIVDKRGLHPLSCIKSSGRFFRHSEVNNLIKKALVSADVPAQLEPTGLDRNDGKRPDGATIIPWSKGQCLVWDFTCSDTYAGSYINQTQKQTGAAAEMATQRKHNKYTNIKSRGLQLVVLGVETAGPWCKEGKDWINEIGRKLIEKTGDFRARSYLVQRISMTIQKGNVASIIGSSPADDDLKSIFYL